MPQTLSDGSSIVLVYTLATLLALVLVLPLSPFMKKLYRSHALSFVLALFILLIFYAWMTLPFSNQAPLRVLFQQRVEIDLALEVLRSGNNSRMASRRVGDTHSSPRMITTLAGHPDVYPSMFQSWMNRPRSSVCSSYLFNQLG